MSRARGRHHRLVTRALAVAFAFVILAAERGLWAADQSGTVTFAGLPVPGATVTASQAEKHVVTSTDQQGGYRFPDLVDGTWTIRVEMLGFSPISQDVTIAPGSSPSVFALKLLSFDEIARMAGPPQGGSSDNAAGRASGPPQAANAPSANAPKTPAPPRQAGASASGAGNGNPNGFQRAAVTASAPPPAAAADSGAPSLPGAASGSADSTGLGAADGLLVNGSVNNGAASPFAQLAAFGNNRRGARSLYNWSLGAILGNSALDARPFSFTSQPAPKPSYTDTQFLSAFGGPIKIPGVSPNKRPNLFLAYQRTSNHSATTVPGIVPTLLERGGDFSQSLNVSGQPVQIIDPTTGQPFPGNVIPAQRISPQAAALLGYYPTPNVAAGGGVNYQTPILTTTRQDAVQARITQVFSGKTQMFGNVSYQRNTTDTGNLFGFPDANEVSTLDTFANWSHRFSQFLSLRLRYEFTRIATDLTPYFANRENVSGLAGITGDNQDPVNWGPPSLAFSSGVAGLSTGQYASNHDLTNHWTAESLWNHGRHNFTIGGDVSLRHLDALSQQNARGSFAFTGAATGDALADFLLGLPQTSSIAFSATPNKHFRSSTDDAYVTDDWRISPGLTANVGMRWEYEAPMTELYGRLVNLDVAPGFTAVSQVLASNPVGSLTGQHYPDSLIRPDRLGFQPRLAVAWRPVAGSSLLVRAGYGIYRNTSVYQPIAALLAQQPPLSTTLSVQTSAANPLTLANGFVAAPGLTPNTFAVDPNLRVGYAQNWQLSVQRDLPASLTMVATYLGTRGSHLMQESLPNTYPLGAVNPCPSCPSGFVYLTSNGTSSREAGQFQLRRRLRSGLTATVQYTLAKATDDATAFGGASLSGTSIAQNWLDPDAERGPSTFDQRHLVTAQVQYTTGMGVGGGALLTGVKGTLFKGWTVTSQLTAGSGLPLTPIYFAAVPGTGVTGTIRPDLTGVSAGAVSSGSYVNPFAFSAPAAGQWGTAGRNSIRGPAQFGLNAGLGRSFLLGERLTLDWRFDATNVLNRVTYSTISTIVGSPQFGQPTQTNPMRTLQSTLRLRF